jgi:hypothetical protein
VPDEVDPNLRSELVQLSDERTEAALADDARPVLHLPIRHLAEGLLHPVPDPAQPIPQAGRSVAWFASALITRHTRTSNDPPAAAS